MFERKDRKRKFLIALTALAIGSAFFLAYSFLPLTAPLRFNSPDENANYFFSGTFVDGSRLWSFEPLDLAVPGLVHPRSMRIIDNFLVPVGFIGLPVIFGSIAKVAGMGAVPFLTPLFAVLAAAAFASIVGRFFGRRTGVLSGLLLLVCPVWWYEASRTLMPNILFVSLAVFAAWFLLTAPVLAARAGKPRKSYDLVWRADGALAGLCFGLALAVRPSEVYWLALIAAVLFVANRRKLPWSRLALFILFAAGILLPFFGMNKALYGNWLGTGYAVSAGEQAVASLPAGHGARLLGGLQPYLFPLGFAPRTAWHNFWLYGARFFWFWTLLVGISAAAAVFAAWRRRRAAKPLDRNAVVYALVLGLTSVWLVLFYGSWTIQDNPDPTAVTIGTSYFRYWLPIFLLSVVPAAWALGAAAERLAGRWCIPALAAVIAVLAAVSAHAIFTAPQEGLLVLRDNLRRYDSEVKQVLAKTEKNALIVVDRADKLFFPDRSVIYPLRSEQTYAALGDLGRHVPLYYFGIAFPEKDLEYLRQEKLPPLGLTIEPVLSFGEEALYALPRLPAQRP